MFELKNVPTERTIYVRITGPQSAAQMREFASAYCQATDSYRGEPHLVLADMRGLVPAAVDAAEIFGQAIAYGRTHGVACCIHVADSAIARLQTGRLARAASPLDTATIETTSIDEAMSILGEKRAALRGPSPASAS